jgi:hypothetical protein
MSIFHDDELSDDQYNLLSGRTLASWSESLEAMREGGIEAAAYAESRVVKAKADWSQLTGRTAELLDGATLEPCDRHGLTDRCAAKLVA